MAKRKALVIYGSITGNTQLVAKEFGKVLTENGFEAELVKIDPKRDWDKDPIFVEDYDLVCLGSPIVGGFPLQAVIKAFSFGAGGALEKEVQNNLDSNKADAAAPAKKPEGAEWRRTKAPSPGMANHQGKRPYGIVFTTYGGGFYGVDEATCTLETLKLYLKLNNVDVIGRFSCGGKETGPAGYPWGSSPRRTSSPARSWKARMRMCAMRCSIPWATGPRCPAPTLSTTTTRASPAPGSR